MRVGPNRREESRDWSWKDLISPLITIAVIFVIGNSALNATLEGLEQQRYEDCVEHFNSTDFSNETVGGQYVCVQEGEVYEPEVTSLMTGNPVYDILSAPGKILNLIPWWIEAPAIILLTLCIVYIASTVGPRV